MTPGWAGVIWEGIMDNSWELINISSIPMTIL